MLVVATFYRFFKVISCRVLKAELKDLLENSKLYGTIILAPEGINGTICGSRLNIDKLVAFFKEAGFFSQMEYKESLAQSNPFFRRQIKIKKEIVTLGEPNIDPSSFTGQYVDSRAWDQLLLDPSVVVLDVRNLYETAIGSFVNAIDPKLNNFREFCTFAKTKLDKTVHKRIAMSCTGGIRCEKASAYLLQLGFPEVYQLKGGILKYLEDTAKETSHWQGECFVFDQRVAVNHDRLMGTYEMCFGCRAPLSDEDKKSDAYVESVCCPKCHSDLTKDKHKSRQTRRDQMVRALKDGRKHLGPDAMPKKCQTPSTL